uniref:Dephospho-CoA kinase n=1 Tax=Fervidicoccus fontis TaxID=683846 RepID=A0A7J3ZIU2_9CREN
MDNDKGHALSSRRLLVAIAGLPGSGKSMVARVLGDIGLKVYVMGDVVRRELERLGLEETVENLVRVALEIRRKHGMGGVAELMLRALESEKSWPIVIDGIRSVEELKVFSRITDCIRVVAVHASPHTRYKRLRARGRPGDPGSWKEFVQRDVLEIKLGIGNVIALADIVFINESGIENLVESVKSRLGEILECSGRYVWKFL